MTCPALWALLLLAGALPARAEERCVLPQHIDGPVRFEPSSLARLLKGIRVSTGRPAAPGARPDDEPAPQEEPPGDADEAVECTLRLDGSSLSWRCPSQGATKEASGRVRCRRAGAGLELTVEGNSAWLHQLSLDGSAIAEVCEGQVDARRCASGVHLTSWGRQELGEGAESAESVAEQAKEAREADAQRKRELREEAEAARRDDARRRTLQALFTRSAPPAVPQATARLKNACLGGERAACEQLQAEPKKPEKKKAEPPDRCSQLARQAGACAAAQRAKAEACHPAQFACSGRCFDVHTSCVFAKLTGRNIKACDAQLTGCEASCDRAFEACAPRCEPIPQECREGAFRPAE